MFLNLSFLFLSSKRVLAVVLLLFLTACEGVVDSQLRAEREIAEKRIETALNRGRPDDAQLALHKFSQEIDDAEERGLASIRQVENARTFVDHSMRQIDIIREEERLAEISSEVDFLVAEKNFLQARYFVRVNLFHAGISEQMQEHLLSMLDRIERSQIDLIEQLVRNELDRGAIKLARARVDLALVGAEFSPTGTGRLKRLAGEIEAAEQSRQVHAASTATPVVRPPVPKSSSSSQSSGRREYSVSVISGIEFSHVPSGTYRVGSPSNEAGREFSREVEPERFFLREFFISTTEITQDTFARVIPRIWRNFSGTNIPAHSVSFSEAQEFCQGLSELDSEWIFDLPTEVEWEVAARGLKSPSMGPINAQREDRERFLGALEKATFALQKYAFFRPNRRGPGPMVVGLKIPNDLGLYDVHGNVAEWCRLDPALAHWPQGSLVERPIRGGSVLSDYERCRSGARSFEKENTRKPTIGFRIVGRRKKGL